MGMEVADPMRTPRDKTLASTMPPRYAVIAGQLFPVPLAARPLLSISAFRAKFGLRVIWLSEVRVGGLFRVATPLVAGERPSRPGGARFKEKVPAAREVGV